MNLTRNTSFTYKIHTQSPIGGRKWEGTRRLAKYAGRRIAGAGANTKVKPKDKEESGIKADIPESVFEEALKAIERIHTESRAGGKVAAKPPVTAQKRPASQASDIDEIMNLLGNVDEVATPIEEEKPEPKPPQEMDSDLQVLSNLLEEEYNLEKEADFFKSVLFEDLQGDKKTIDESVLKEKEGQIKELMDRLSDLKKEFDKFKQRITKEAETAKRFSNESLIKKLLPILDNFERAIEHADSTEEKAAMIQGVQLIYKQLSDTLMKVGLSRVDAKGREFDPNLHDAITTVETSEVSPNIVISEYLKGYLLHERLIRPARVVVSVRPNGTSAQSSEEEKRTGV